MVKIQGSPNEQAAADTPQTAPMLTPEQAVEQLRAMLQQIPDVPSLTAQERKLLHGHTRMPESEVQASINVVGASDKVANVLGQPVDAVRQLVDDANRWTVVEQEVRGVLKGVSDANLVRRQRAKVIAIQAYSIGQQLVRDPANAVLVPHVQEIKRLKSFSRRKKPAQTPQTSPAPGTSPQPSSPAPGTSTSPQTPAPGTPPVTKA